MRFFMILSFNDNCDGERGERDKEKERVCVGDDDQFIHDRALNF